MDYLKKVIELRAAIKLVIANSDLKKCFALLPGLAEEYEITKKIISAIEALQTGVIRGTVPMVEAQRVAFELWEFSEDVKKFMEHLICVEMLRREREALEQKK